MIRGYTLAKSSKKALNSRSLTFNVLCVLYVSRDACYFHKTVHARPTIPKIRRNLVGMVTMSLFGKPRVVARL